MAQQPPHRSANPTRRAHAARASVTMSDVARLAGVSPITVSRVLNHPERVSPGVRERVHGAIGKTGYVPNLLAGGLRSSKSRLIAAIVPTIESPAFLQVVQGLTHKLDEAGYQLMLGQSGYTQSREDALVQAIVGRRPDGIVLTGILHSDACRKLLQASGIPVVETWDLTPTPIDMAIGFSHEKVGAAVCEYFHRNGRRRPVLITGGDDRALRRAQGFMEAAQRLGLRHDALAGVPLRQLETPTSLQTGREGFAELWRRYPDLDAVFCSSDQAALGVLTEAQAQGIAVPERVAVVGLGDLPFAASLHPALTTVRIDGYAMGCQAAQYLLDRLAGRPAVAGAVDIGFSIIQRQSG
jgi:LacI family gluconate utilization system Gnt-I transcriptional repressor